MNIACLSSTSPDFELRLASLLQWEASTDEDVDTTVRDILGRLKREGDGALLSLTHQFDRIEAPDVTALEIDADELQAALTRIADNDRVALEQAADRIRAYHEHQIENSWSYTDEVGNVLGQKITPLDRVGVYVPGGQASYPSSVLMTLVPAKVAGVEEVIVTVPTPNGERNDMVLAALAIAGVSRVFTIGGAQAIGALAYGTATIPRVDKIVGPGNAYVAAAKRQVFGQVGIDVIAGPSEVLVIADGSTNPQWTALDLFSQAEHDPIAQSILLSPDVDFVHAVEAEMRDLLPNMSRQSIITQSLGARGALITTSSLDEALDIANRIAPEHLELHVRDELMSSCVDQIRHAGAIFCGAHTAETFGDYVAGPSHVLPTFGTARFASPLGVYDFVKRSSVINLSIQGAAQLAQTAVALANSEGLQAHALAAAVRAGNLEA